MKKIKYIIFLCTILLLIGCAKAPKNSTEESSVKPTNTSDNLATMESVENSTSTETSIETSIEESSTTTILSDADCNLTSMEDHKAYETLEHIQLNPDDYVGKNITIKGEYSSVFYSHSQQRYHYVLLSDSDGCSQMLEFIWDSGNHIYPDEYPKENTIIEVSGTFETYQDKGDPSIYCRLSNATLKVVE